MGCIDVLLCILLPPLAVIDDGCGSVAIVAVLTLFGWIPGAIAALIIKNKGGQVVVMQQPIVKENVRPIVKKPLTEAEKKKQQETWITVGAVLFMVFIVLPTMCAMLGWVMKLAGVPSY